MNKPYALKTNDKIAIIAPASPTEIKNIEKVKIAIKKLGLSPVIFPSCYEKHGHFSGIDAIRAKDINDAFLDPSIKGIICLKGGYGTPRLLTLLNYDIIKNNPKIFIGYSDITALHIAFAKKCNMVTYHGPMAAAGLLGVLDEYTLKYLKKALFSYDSLNLLENPENEKIETLVDGVSNGKIIGGNLSLLVSTLGSPYEIDVKGKILFIEEVGELNYKIDRMLTSLALANKFKDCSGIILGTFSNCKPDFRNGVQKDLNLDLIFNEIIVPYNKPTISNFRAGHNYPQPTIPFGVDIELDASKKTITFLENSNIKPL
ncbi:S66 peptidase family protein [Helicovermis profundi]|uniref:LD-carboxypeptidase n=1 Tax=Helicovermis profundi TaxID=3065157 RepID=A0AAU9E2T2_9FIRM|nr:LD-carboxypeptidase [Clostridia bacterium S502]